MKTLEYDGGELRIFADYNVVRLEDYWGECVYRYDVLRYTSEIADRRNALDTIILHGKMSVAMIPDGSYNGFNPAYKKNEDAIVDAFIQCHGDRSFPSVELRADQFRRHDWIDTEDGVRKMIDRFEQLTDSRVRIIFSDDDGIECHREQPMTGVKIVR